MQSSFGPFTLDFETRQLTRDGSECHLSPKAFDLLATLVQERPKALSKAVLLERLWPGTFVEEANLSNLVAEIRAALDDSARNPRYLRTSHRFGYAFCAEGRRAAPSDRPLCWIEWRSRRFPLLAGEHVVGRDPDVAIRLDAATVSRRHARLTVTADGAILEDFESKNGTWRGRDRLTAPVRLADGDEIRIGSQTMTFRVRSSESTETLIIEQT